MPLGASKWWIWIFCDEILIQRENFWFRVVTDEYGEIDFIQGKKSDVAKRWKIDGFEGDFGIIGIYWIRILVVKFLLVKLNS